MNKQFLTWNAHFGLVVIGITQTSLGPVLPSVIGEYRLSLATAGLVFTCIGLGRLVAVFFAGTWSDTIGRRPVMSLGAALIGLGALLYGSSSLWLGHLIAALTMGAGVGMLDGGTNSLIADLYPERKGFAINRLHVFFGVGALIGPLLAAMAVNRFSTWRVAFFVLAAAAAISAVSSVLLTFPSSSSSHKLTRDELRQARSAFLIDRRFWFLVLLMFMAIGIASAITGWVSKFLGDEMAATVLASSTVLTLYNVGVTAGRMVFSYIVEKLGYARSLLMASVGGFLFVSLAVIGRDIWWVAVSFWLTGLFTSGIFPTAVAHGIQLFPSLRGTVSGYLITAAALGSMVVPFLIGAFSDVVGIGSGMLGVAFFGLLQIGIASALWRASRLSEGADGAETT